MAGKSNTKANATKKDEVVTVATTYQYFQSLTLNQVVKLNYSDAAQKYCGYDDFSVNFKCNKSKVQWYAVYMSEANAQVCTSIDDTLEVEVNASDTTKKQLRCKLIRFTSYETLCKCIEAVTKAKFSIA